MSVLIEHLEHHRALKLAIAIAMKVERKELLQRQWVAIDRVQAMLLDVRNNVSQFKDETFTGAVRRLELAQAERTAPSLVIARCPHVPLFPRHAT